MAILFAILDIESAEIFARSAGSEISEAHIGIIIDSHFKTFQCGEGCSSVVHEFATKGVAVMP